MKKAASNLGTAILVMLIVAAALTFLAPRFGWSVDAVFSGSMEPQIKVGSVIITRPVEPETIKVRDVITFNSPHRDIPITHRVVAVEHNPDLYFMTKGDANEDADPITVSAQDVVGKVSLHLPYFGYISQFIKTPLGFLLTLSIPGIIIIAMEIRNVRRVLTEEQV